MRIMAIRQSYLPLQHRRGYVCDTGSWFWSPQIKVDGEKPERPEQKGQSNKICGEVGGSRACLVWQRNRGT